jgi:hypothetical protein
VACGLSSRLSGLRGVSGDAAAHTLPGGSLLPARCKPEVGFPSPKSVFPNFCVTNTSWCDSSAGYRHQTVVRAKWRNAHRGGVLLAHSRPSSTQAKFLPETMRPSGDTDDALIHLFSRLPRCTSVRFVSIYWPAALLRLSHANLPGIGQASRVLGMVLVLALRRRPHSERGAR